MSYIVKAEDTADISTPPTHYTVLDKDITIKPRKTLSDKPSELYHLSPKSKQKAGDKTLPLGTSLLPSPTHTVADNWDRHTEFATKLQLDSPDSKILDLGGTE